MVRFSTRRQDRAGAQGGNGVGQRAYWVAVVTYRFSGAPMAIEDRLLKPLGFQVVQYRRYQEAPPLVEEPGAADIVAGGAAAPALVKREAGPGVEAALPDMAVPRPGGVPARMRRPFGTGHRPEHRQPGRALP